MTMTLSERDQAVIWHPYTQMQGAPAPLPVVAGYGPWLELEGGRKVLDMISSWWVNVHGHAHPHVAEAISRQASILEQVIFAGFTHPEAVGLAERLLAKLGSHMARVFFTDDGSTAVEVALKMAWQYWQHQDAPRNQILALADAYHGDTFGAMSVSGRSIFTKAFAPLLFEVGEVPSPADASIADVLATMARLHAQNPVAAIIVEPLVQGAGGMKMYAPEKLSAMVEWCQSQGILVIFDEVMTGFYRTGTCFAADQLRLKPDITCLSKGLTAGFLPMAVTACSAKIFDAFLSDDRSKMLFHGHSFTANPLGCAAANASLDIFELDSTKDQIAQIAAQQQAAVQRFSQLRPIKNVRQCGTILAMDWEGGTGYLQAKGTQIAQEMLKRDILLRPLGNVIYILPPYCTTADQLDHVYDQLEEVIRELDWEE